MVFASVFVDIDEVTVEPSAFVVVTLTIVGIDVVFTTDVLFDELSESEVEVCCLTLVDGGVVVLEESTGVEVGELPGVDVESFGVELCELPVAATSRL